MSLASSGVHSQYILFNDTATEQEGVNGSKKALRKRRLTDMNMTCVTSPASKQEAGEQHIPRSCDITLM